jgi:hypothetical protein
MEQPVGNPAKASTGAVLRRLALKNREIFAHFICSRVLPRRVLCPCQHEFSTLLEQVTSAIGASTLFPIVWASAISTT